MRSKIEYFPTAIEVVQATAKDTLLQEKAAKPKKFNRDGWENVLTGLGRKGRDRSVSTKMKDYDILEYDELANLYAGDGPATKIVDCVAEDMTRNGWRVNGDDAQETLYKLGEEIDLTAKVTEAMRWQRLFGGAIIVKEYAGDGSRLENPVRKNARLVRLRVYSAPQVELENSKFSDNPNSPYYEDVEVFQIKKKYGGSFRVHASRCEVLKGKPWPYSKFRTYTLQQKYWGMSELQAPYLSLSILGSFVQGIGHAGQEMAVSKYRLSNLMQILAENSTDALYARMESIEMSKSLINAVLLGKDEEWGRDQLSFVGLPEVFDRLAMMVSGSSNIPVTKVFGRSAAGLNSTGEGDTRDYYDMLNSKQTSVLAPLLRRLYIALKSSVEDYEISFNPAWTPTQAELIDMRFKQAQTDDINMNKLLIVKSEELRASRLEGGYGFETVVGGKKVQGQKKKTIEGGV